MPTYEYECDACSHAFEQFQSMSDPPLKKCPKCRKSKLRRLIGTGGGLIFKGSGFHGTDYRSESYKKAAEADRPATTPAGGDPKPPTDVKPSTDTAAKTASESKPNKEPAASKPAKKTKR